jgi:hypothetical protein
MPVSHRALQTLADALRQRPRILGSQWRRLAAGEQELLVLAHLNKGGTSPVRKWRSLKIKMRSVSSVRAVSNPGSGWRAGWALEAAVIPIEPTADRGGADAVVEPEQLAYYALVAAEHVSQLRSWSTIG